MEARGGGCQEPFPTESFRIVSNRQIRRAGSLSMTLRRICFTAAFMLDWPKRVVPLTKLPAPACDRLTACAIRLVSRSGFIVFITGWLRFKPATSRAPPAGSDRTAGHLGFVIHLLSGSHHGLCRRKNWLPVAGLFVNVSEMSGAVSRRGGVQRLHPFDHVAADGGVGEQPLLL